MPVDSSLTPVGARLPGGNPEGPDASKEQWVSDVTRVGIAGLQLNKFIDQLDPTELSRMLNLVHTGNGRISSRLGLTAFANPGPASVHSISRLSDPRASTYVHFYGAQTALLRDAAVVDTGYSGAPLTFVPFRPSISSSPWMVVCDRNKMSITGVSGSTLPLGLAAPTVQASAVPAAQLKKVIASFNSSDSTSSGFWQPNSGYDRSSTPIPTLDAGTKEDTSIDPNNPALTGVGFITAPGAAQTGYSTYWNCPLGPLDLTTLNGSVAASDDDIIHFWIQTNNQRDLEEVRIYLVCNDGFSITALPGENPDGSASDNTDAYVKSFAQSDLQQFVSQQASAQTTAQAVADKAARRALLDQERETRQPYDSTPIEPPTIYPGQTPTEMGIIGVPIRRGDFQRIGNTPGRNWSTITGIVVFIQTTTVHSVEVALQTMYLTGGYGPDTSDPTFAQYDYRYTYYDPRTGFESNPSPIMTTAIDALRQQVTLTPGAPHADSAVRERWYRRGGSLSTDWFFLDTSSGHNAPYTDDNADAEIEASGTLATNHDQPVTTVDSSGNAVRNVPLSALWGPTDGGFVFGCGDPYQPGYLYWSIPGQIGHWPAANTVEVCSSSEELMNGAVWGGQAYVFSREHLYVIYPDFDGNGSVRVNSTACVHGLASRWGMANTPQGLAFVAKDGIRMTTGAGSDLLSDPIRPLFNGQTVNGYEPIDFTSDEDIQLTYHNNDLWFIYRDTGGILNCLIYSLLYKYWRPYRFAAPIASAFSETGKATGADVLLLGGDQSGKVYTHSGYTDDGDVISWSLRTGSFDSGFPRQEKQYGDVFVDGDFQGQTISATVYVDAENVANTTQLVTATAGRRRLIFDAFGATPQKARTIAVDLSGDTPTDAQVGIDMIGISRIVQPDITMKRSTNWDDLGSATEKYLTGIQIEADTFGSPVDLAVEFSFAGVITTAANITVTCNGRHKRRFSWPAVKADLVRIRPTDDCAPWELYRLDWLAQSEPPRIARWDTNYETKGDAYLTGVDIECNTFNVAKTVQFYADDVLIATKSITANGRRVVHVTFDISTPIRAHIFRFVATDDHDGLLYAWNWIADPEPLEQTNWNQNYSIAHSLTDKYLKGVLLECDTYGQNKSVNIEIDGVTVETLTVNQNNRGVLEFSFPQHLGRVFRLLPTDSNPGRLYSMQWIFDEEPLKLSRWETQETDHDIHGWQSVLYSYITLKSVSTVTLTVNIYGNDGTVIATQVYSLASTGGIKAKRYVTFNANKGALYKYTLTAGSAFHLYREETQVFVKQWGGNEPFIKRPFGNDDLDATRGMGSAELSGAHAGGQAQ